MFYLSWKKGMYDILHRHFERYVRMDLWILTPLFRSKTYLCYRIGTKHVAIENPLFEDVALTQPLKCWPGYTRNFLCKLRILLYVNNVRRVQRNKLLYLPSRCLRVYFLQKVRRQPSKLSLKVRLGSSSLISWHSLLSCPFTFVVLAMVDRWHHSLVIPDLYVPGEIKVN